MAFLDNDGLQHLISTIKSKLDLKSDKTHTHNYAGSSSAGGAANSALKSNSLVGFATAGSGAAYTATVSGITALTAGVSFIMIPHTAPTTTAPTLNVNGLGAKNLRRRVSNSTTITTDLSSTTLLAANKPVQVTYDGSYWIVDMVRPNANDLYGTVPESSLPTMIAYGTDAPTSSTAGYIYIQTI